MSITERARDRAECIVRNARTRIGLTDREAGLYVDGFRSGARWAASLPPTDEEVVAALDAAIDAGVWCGDHDLGPERDCPNCRHCAEVIARAALTAAREAQR